MQDRQSRAPSGETPHTFLSRCFLFPVQTIELPSEEEGRMKAIEERTGAEKEVRDGDDDGVGVGLVA